MKHLPNSKGDNYYMLCYGSDSLYNTKALTSSHLLLSLEDMGKPTHVSVLHSMLLKALPF